MTRPAHIPVMRDEVVELMNVRDGGRYVDGTFGAGGYTAAFLEAAKCTVHGFDRDPDAIAGARSLLDKYEERLCLHQNRFSEIETVLLALGIESVDGVALDIGVSSMQLDDPERGFSFMRDTALDMRMEKDGPTASDLINQASERDLVHVLRVYGEERRARAIARAIIEARKVHPLSTTGELVRLVEGVFGTSAARMKIHCATRTFQAIRIWTNNELLELAKGLSAAERLLAPAGRLVVVAFHSLESGIVKRFFSQRFDDLPHPSRHAPPEQADKRPSPSFRALFRKAVKPSASEIEVNPRSRSAILRAGERTDAPPIPLDLFALGLPQEVSR